MNFLSIFDMFGVTFNLSQKPQQKDSTYKSVLGGLVSLLILTLGLIYSSNLILRWFGNQLIMKISSQEELYSSDTFGDKFQNDNFNTTFSIDVWNTVIDPFVENEIYILPLLINITSAQIKNVLYYHNQADESLKLVIKDSLEFNQYILVFVSCQGNENFLNNNQKCASQEKLNDFFSTTGLEIHTTIITRTLNVYTSEIAEQKSFIAMYLQKSMIPDYTVLLEYSYYELRHGQFFSETSDFFLLMNDFTYQTTFCEPGFIDSNLLYYKLGDNKLVSNVVAKINLTTQLNVKHVIAEYPAVSEVLANVGSTFQTMFLVKYLMLYLNQYKMSNELKDFFRDLYFPEIKKIASVKKGKSQILYLEKNKLDPKQYSQFLKELDRRINQKMNFANLIYEISRMQVLLQDFIAKSSQFSQKRSALKLKLNEKTHLYEIINFCEQNDPNKNTFILDSTIDPFIYSFPLGNEQNDTIINQDHKNQMMKSDIQFQPEILIVHENEEIQLDNRNIIYSESMRPQQSF